MNVIIDGTLGNEKQARILLDRLQAAGVHRWARGEEKASDHAPTWISLSEGP